MLSSHVKRAVGVLCLCSVLLACQSAMYRALETVGIEKRDILVDRIAEARDAQSAAKDQFSSALDQFRSIVTVQGGDLEETYDRLNAEYERTQARADAVDQRIRAVERVANDLFAEWERELDEYSSPALRADSARLLRDTERRYGELIRAMHRAQGRMEPVLAVFHDNVLALKHNLNAQAIRGLKGELASIERQTAALIRDMERAIAEADQFIQGMQQQQS